MLDMLLQHGADISTPSPKDGNTAIHLAALWGREDAVKFLVEHDAVRNGGPCPTTPSLFCLHLREWFNTHFRKASMYACSYFQDVSALNHDRETPLHLAAKMGHARILELLLEGGNVVDPHVMDYQGRTPSVIAAGSHVRECSDVLR
jgi:ankyrin repeat protein